MIEYKAMSLFDAPEGSIIIHAVNAQGVWGSGIAKEFKVRYPEAFEFYHSSSKLYNILGHGKLFCSYKEKHQASWICTSENYGDKKDSPFAILANTVLAVNDICEDIEVNRIFSGENEITVYSNKFNSGLFNVPWEQTEEVLKQVLKKYPKVKWIVCDPSLIVDEWA